MLSTDVSVCSVSVSVEAVLRHTGCNGQCSLNIVSSSLSTWHQFVDQQLNLLTSEKYILGYHKLTSSPPFQGTSLVAGLRCPLLPRLHKGNICFVLILQILTRAVPPPLLRHRCRVNVSCLHCRVIASSLSHCSDRPCLDALDSVLLLCLS